MLNKSPDNGKVTTKKRNAQPNEWPDEALKNQTDKQQTKQVKENGDDWSESKRGNK